jgi:hypothetical protein
MYYNLFFKPKNLINFNILNQPCNRILFIKNNLFYKIFINNNHYKYIYVLYTITIYKKSRLFYNIIKIINYLIFKFFYLLLNSSLLSFIYFSALASKFL